MDRMWFGVNYVGTCDEAVVELTGIDDIGRVGRSRGVG